MRMKPVSGIHIKGETGKLLKNIIEHWLIGIRESNPAILAMFRDRDVKPYRDLLPWSGEFAGKYLTGAYYTYCLTGDKKLYDYAQDFIGELISYIGTDGYIGCFPEGARMSAQPAPEKAGSTWDAWNHYHVIYGLTLWHGETGRADIREAVRRIAEFFLRTFYSSENAGNRLANMGCLEMNLAPLHIFAVLYQETRDKRYLDFCEEILTDLESPEAGAYISHTLGGGEYFQCRKPRWESMHIIMGLAELSDCANDPVYLDVALKIFHSILRTDVHNTGGFSTDEQAAGNPFGDGAVEFCCVIAFNALANILFLKTGDPMIADFLEISHFNAVLGSFSPSGKWSAYNTPMNGSRKANYHDIVFQSRPGSPDLNCCSANSARGPSQIAQWAVTFCENAVFINFYEAFDLKTPEGVRLRVKSDYPASPNVRIYAENLCGHKLFVRIPAWSPNTKLTVRGREFLPAAGRYCEIEAADGEEIRLVMDFTPRYLTGESNYAGKSSLFIGPVLYAWDNARNTSYDFTSLPPVDKNAVGKSRAERQFDGSIVISAGGVRLVDFYHAGHGGSEYKTWLEVK